MTRKQDRSPLDVTEDDFETKVWLKGKKWRWEVWQKGARHYSIGGDSPTSRGASEQARAALKWHVQQFRSYLKNPRGRDSRHHSTDIRFADMIVRGGRLYTLRQDKARRKEALPLLRWAKANWRHPSMSAYGSRYARIMYVPEAVEQLLDDVPAAITGDRVNHWLTTQGQKELGPGPPSETRNPRAGGRVANPWPAVAALADSAVTGTGVGMGLVLGNSVMAGLLRAGSKREKNPYDRHGNYVFSGSGPDGDVVLVPYPGHPGYLTGDTLDDNRLLSALRHPTVFPESQYDALLAKLSEVGFGITTYLDSSRIGVPHRRREARNPYPPASWYRHEIAEALADGDVEAAKDLGGQLGVVERQARRYHIGDRNPHASLTEQQRNFLWLAWVQGGIIASGATVPTRIVVEDLMKLGLLKEGFYVAPRIGSVKGFVLTPQGRKVTIHMQQTLLKNPRNPYSTDAYRHEDVASWPAIKRLHPEAIIRSVSSGDHVLRVAYWGRPSGGQHPNYATVAVLHPLQERNPSKCPQVLGVAR